MDFAARSPDVPRSDPRLFDSRKMVRARDHALDQVSGAQFRGLSRRWMRDVADCLFAETNEREIAGVSVTPDFTAIRPGQPG